MKKGKMGKIFGIALVFVIIGLVSVSGGIANTSHVHAASLSVPSFKQCDSRWGANQLGTCSSETICSAGCAVTSVAMILKYYGVATDPGDLNNWLKNNSGYASGCLIIWDKADDRSGGSVQWAGKYTTEPGDLGTHVSPSELQNQVKWEIDHGYPCVGRDTTYTSHFVVITGYSDSLYYINDPYYDRSTVSKSLITRIYTYHSTSLLPPPALSSPSNGQTGVSTTPTFSWSSVSGANRYWLMVATSQSALPTDPYATSCPSCTISISTPSTSYTPSTPLAERTTYYWQVQAYYWDGTTVTKQGQYSAQWSFTTKSCPHSCWDRSPLSGDELAALVRSRFPLGGVTQTGESIRVTAYAVAKAESGGNPSACGDSDRSIGLWQINIDAHPGYDKCLLFEEDYNANAAAEISNNGRDWNPWCTWEKTACGGNGNEAYKQYLTEARKHFYPKVTSLSVSQTSINLGEAVTIYYSVSDDVGLARVELRRTTDKNGAPDESNWAKVPGKEVSISGTTYSGYFTDTPTSPGIYWYGIRVIDNSGAPEAWNDEKNSRTGNWPGVYGPDKVVVTLAQRTITFYTDPTNGGTITFAGSTYSNGQSTTKPDGTYSVSANPASNYVFNRWTTTGGVSVANPSSQSTTVTVTGDGSIKAWFNFSGEQWQVDLTLTTTPDIGHIPSLGYHFGFGAKDGAVDEYAATDGDEIAPPDPMAGVNAYFYYPANSQYTRNLITSVVAPAASITWPLLVKRIGGTGTVDITLSWDATDIANVPAKYAIIELRDTVGNTLAVMRGVNPVGSYVIPDVSPNTALNYNIVASQNAPPDVSDVSAVQRTDGSGIVDITYNISDNEQARVDVRLEYWDGSWHRCTNTAGDVGSGISTGTGKAATWDAKAQLGAAYISGCKVKVIADDGAGGSDSEESSTFDLDTAPPTGYSCSTPEDEAECVSVDEGLVCSTAVDDSTPVEYKFAIASDPTFGEDLQESDWQQSTNWTPTAALSYGKLYWWKVKARDAKRNESDWSSPFTFVTIYKFDLALKAGWNMISLPLASCTGETDPSVILPDVKAIYSWNCATRSYDSPGEIVPGKGYWALVFEDVTETIYGTPVEEYQLSSDCKGWHMIGSLYVDGQVNVGSGSIYGWLYHWDPQTRSYTVRSSNDIRPGEGYALLALTDFSISVVPKP